jgi:hypothetical protein
MRRWILALGLATGLGFSSDAFAQAAAEAALAHSMSTATGTAMGTTLGRATNQMAGRLGQQTSRTVQPRVTTIKPGLKRLIKVSSATSTTATQPSGGSMIASVQGGGLRQSGAECTPEAPASQGPQNGNGATSVSPASANASSASATETSGTCSKPDGVEAGNTYQSVITLPAAKEK